MGPRHASALVLVLAIAGCHSSKHFPEDYKEAEHAISRAEDAGADRHARFQLASARDTLENARRAEEEAIQDSSEARAQLSAAEKRNLRAEQRLASRNRRKHEAEDLRRVHETTIERLTDREEELHAKGLSDAEVKRLTDVEQSFAQLRMKSIDAELASLDKEIELLELQKKDAALAMNAANARLATAEQRLIVSRALIQRAQDQARIAEAESLDAQRIGVSQRTSEM